MTHAENETQKSTFLSNNTFNPMNHFIQNKDFEIISLVASFKNLSRRTKKTTLGTAGFFTVNMK